MIKFFYGILALIGWLIFLLCLLPTTCIGVNALIFPLTIIWGLLQEE